MVKYHLELFKEVKHLQENPSILGEYGIRVNHVLAKFIRLIKHFIYPMVEKSTITNMDMKFCAFTTGM